MRKKELAIQPQKAMTPGFGQAGLVMCPLFKGACLKQGCELWVELKCGDNFVARCSISWLAVLSTETRESIDRLVLETSKKSR